MLVITLQKFRANNDVNGNPRKAIVVVYTKYENDKAIRQGIRHMTFSYMDYVQALHEHIIDESKYNYRVDLQEIEISVKEFNRLKRLYNNTLELHID